MSNFSILVKSSSDSSLLSAETCASQRGAIEKGIMLAQHLKPGRFLEVRINGDLVWRSDAN